MRSATLPNSNYSHNRRCLARRGGGVRDVSEEFAVFTKLLDTHYTPQNKPSSKKEKSEHHCWQLNNKYSVQSAYANAKKDFKQSYGYDFYD